MLTTLLVLVNRELEIRHIQLWVQFDFSKFMIPLKLEICRSEVMIE